MIMTMVAIIDEQYSSEFPHNFEQMYSKTSSLASAIYTQNWGAVKWASFDSSAGINQFVGKLSKLPRFTVREQVLY